MCHIEVGDSSMTKYEKVQELQTILQSALYGASYKIR